MPSDGGARPARLTTAGRRRLALGREAVSTIHTELEQVPAEMRLDFLVAISALDARTATSRLSNWWFN